MQSAAQCQLYQSTVHSIINF